MEPITGICIPLLACTSFFIEGGLGYLATPSQPPKGMTAPHDRISPLNPYGIVSLGAEYRATSRTMIILQLRHESAIGTSGKIFTNDLGEDSVVFSVRRYFRVRDE